jgi:hypothetical protein
VIGMPDRAWLLAAYDEQLRTEAETAGAVSVTSLGPLRLATFAGGRGFVTYQDLGGAHAEALRRLVAVALAHYLADSAINRIEWKTRRHDHAPGLHDTLLDNGFVADESESIVIGEAQRLAVEVRLPEDVKLRRISQEADVHAMSAMSAEVFGDPDPEAAAVANALLRRLSGR